MATRITQGMINTQLISNLNGNLHRMNNLENQLSTSRRINKPSDDPVGLSYAMRYRSELAANDQYQENVDSATSWLESTDSTIGKAGDVLQRVRELAVQGANGTNSKPAMDAIRSEVHQMYEEMVTIANSQFNGKYIFNGQKTDIPPYTAAGADGATTDNVDINFEIGVGVKLPINVTGNNVFGAAAPLDNAFRALKDLETELGNYNYQGVSAVIGRLDTRIETLLGVRADIGARANRVDLSSARLKDINTNLQALQSKVEDVDVAEAMVNLKTAQNVQQASLSVGAQIIRPSLVDFLR